MSHMARKDDLTEVEQAEKRYQRLLEKRDRYNAEGRAVRQERDLLNEKKGTVRKEANALRDKRSQLLTEVREHKAARNDLQKRAKELIQVRRQLRGELKGGVAGQVKRFRDRIAQLEREQETQSLSLDAEARLLENLRGARQELAEVEKIQRDHEDVLQEVGELDTAIDDHFARADVAHEHVVQKSEAAQTLRPAIDEKFDELSRLIAEANRVHELYLKVRERADYYHQRGVEMRKKVITIRRSRRAEAKEGRKLVAKQKAAVEQALDDDEKLDEAVDEALATLRKGGKLEL